jgi:hypothetical protein
MLIFCFLSNFAGHCNPRAPVCILSVLRKGRSKQYRLDSSQNLKIRVALFFQFEDDLLRNIAVGVKPTFPMNYYEFFGGRGNARIDP